MPVRSLNSSVIKWPDLQQVHSALLERVEQVVAQRSDILRIGYIGSYARGDWGVGSDLDLIVILENRDEFPLQQPLELEFIDLPVSVDVLVYTLNEWRKIIQQGGRFYRMVEKEAVWVYHQGEENP